MSFESHLRNIFIGGDYGDGSFLETWNASKALFPRSRFHVFSFYQVESMCIELKKRKGGGNERRLQNNWVKSGVKNFHSRAKNDSDFPKRRKN